MAEISPTPIMVFMPVNQVDTTFEYAVIFVCWIMFRVSLQHRERNCYMIMLLTKLLITYIIYQLILTSSDA